MLLYFCDEIWRLLFYAWGSRVGTLSWDQACLRNYCMKMEGDDGVYVKAHLRFLRWRIALNTSLYDFLCWSNIFWHLGTVQFLTMFLWSFSLSNGQWWLYFTRTEDTAHIHHILRCEVTKFCIKLMRRQSLCVMVTTFLCLTTLLILTVQSKRRSKVRMPKLWILFINTRMQMMLPLGLTFWSFCVVDSGRSHVHARW